MGSRTLSRLPIGGTVYHWRSQYYGYEAQRVWTRLMGTTVYDYKDSEREGVHIYCHSRKDRKTGVVYLIINNSLTDVAMVELPKEAERYTLSAETMRSVVVQLNGKKLSVFGTSEISDLIPEHQSSGIVALSPGSCTFLVL